MLNSTFNQCGMILLKSTKETSLPTHSEDSQSGMTVVEVLVAMVVLVIIILSAATLFSGALQADFTASQNSLAAHVAYQALSQLEANYSAEAAYDAQNNLAFTWPGTLNQITTSTYNTTNGGVAFTVTVSQQTCNSARTSVIEIQITVTSPKLTVPYVINTTYSPPGGPLCP
jgi:prepilin-type N-terminal cleavage/methylation domain-containing protein